MHARIHAHNVKTHVNKHTRIIHPTHMCTVNMDMYTHTLHLYTLNFYTCTHTHDSYTHLISAFDVIHTHYYTHSLYTRIYYTRTLNTCTAHTNKVH